MLIWAIGGLFLGVYCVIEAINTPVGLELFDRTGIDSFARSAAHDTTSAVPYPTRPFLGRMPILREMLYHSDMSPYISTLRVAIFRAQNRFGLCAARKPMALGFPRPLVLRFP